MTIQLGKEKFETSVLEKTKAPEWNEECDLYVRSGYDDVVDCGRMQNSSCTV